jgi:hypothetical protein
MAKVLPHGKTSAELLAAREAADLEKQKQSRSFPPTKPESVPALSVHEGLRDLDAVALLMKTIREEDVEALSHVGHHALQLMQEETVCQVTCSGGWVGMCGAPIPIEVHVLAWAASTFAPRADDLGDAQPIDFAPAFAVLPSPEPWWSRWGLASEEAPKLRYNVANAKRAIQALRQSISEGDGDSMVEVAAKVQHCYGQYLKHRSLALKIYNGSELRAYTWVAKVLGERCQNGDFGSKMTPEEEAMIARLKAIVERNHELGPAETVSSMETWTRQIAAALADIRAAPASDGYEESFASRRHLAKLLKPVLPTLENDQAGCMDMQAVFALDKVIMFDADSDGDFDENDICDGKLDLSAIYKLEQTVKAASKLPLEARYVTEAETLLAKRRVERSIIEGIKELNRSDLQAALDDIDEKRAAGTPYGIIPELEPPARRVLKRLQLSERLEEATDARNKADLTIAISEADQMGAVVSDLIRNSFEAVLTAAKAMVAKIDAFAACKTAMDAEDVIGLHAAIASVSGAWYIQNHWYEADKTELKSYQLAYKRLTVLTELEKNMEPLNVAGLQGALDTALQVKTVDPLVDKAIEILKSIDREKELGAFVKPHDAGGAYGGDEWLSNPHFKVTFANRGQDTPSKVKVSIICTEGKGDGDDADYFGAFAVHVVRMPGNPDAAEAQPGFELIASSDYSMDTTVLTIDELDCSQGCFIIPSTQIKGEEGTQVRF